MRFHKVHPLSLAEFEAQFGHEKPYYEFWYGEAIQKSMPTWIHGLLQRILMELLRGAGYKTGSEVKLKIGRLKSDPAIGVGPVLGRGELC